MINLLPPHEKEILRLDKKKKLVIILGVIVIIPLVCFMLMLLSIKFYLLGEINVQGIMLEQAKKQYENPDFLAFKGIIQKNNGTLITLSSFYKNEIYVTQALKTISSVPRPNNVHLIDLSVKRGIDKKFNVTVSGFSDSRDDLLIFQKNIGEIKEIINPEFSPESWVNPQNITFHLAFDILQQ